MGSSFRPPCANERGQPAFSRAGVKDFDNVLVVHHAPQSGIILVADFGLALMEGNIGTGPRFELLIADDQLVEGQINW